MLTGPAIVPSKTTSALILCHGYGANGADLADLAPLFQQHFPTLAVFCPDAPTPLSFGGYEWFSLNDFTPQQTITENYLDILANRAKPSAILLQTFRRHIQQKFCIEDNKLILGGFSQGGLVAQIAGLTDETPIGGLLAFSSVPLVFKTAVLKDQVKQHLDILLTHGGQDTVIMPQAMALSQTQLKSVHQKIKTHLSPNLGHGIDESCLKKAIDFLKPIIDRID